MSQRRVLDQERDASHAFLDHMLREEKDKAFVIHFDHEVELLQDLTSSRQKLEASLDQLGRPQFFADGRKRGVIGKRSGQHHRQQRWRRRARLTRLRRWWRHAAVRRSVPGVG